MTLSRLFPSRASLVAMIAGACAGAAAVAVLLALDAWFGGLSLSPGAGKGPIVASPAKPGDCRSFQTDVTQPSMGQANPALAGAAAVRRVQGTVCMNPDGSWGLVPSQPKSPSDQG